MSLINCFITQNYKAQLPLTLDKSKNIPFIISYYDKVNNGKVVKKFVLSSQIFNHIFQKYLKIKMLFFH